MDELKQNYYGSLCTEMYEILHAQAPQDEFLRACGFENILTYSAYQKEIAVDDACEMFLYECSI